MKKLLFPIAAVAAIFVSCTEKEITSPEVQSGEPFSFHASIRTDDAPDSKTSLSVEGSTYKVTWDEGDQLSVVAVYSDNSTKAYQFTKGDGNTFTCVNVENPGDIKALNVFYPYDKNQYDMDGEFGRAGMSFGMNATQNGTDNTGHVDGPLYGYAEVTDGIAEVSMAHASTLFDIQVVNEGASDISVSEISLTAGEQTWLMGRFQINPRNGDLKLTNAKYYISELTVTDGTVKAGQAGHFYITTTPFGMTAGSELTVTVTASGKDYVVKKAIGKDVTFGDGKVNHVTDIAVSPEPSLSLSATSLATTVSSGEIPLQVYAYGNWTATAEGTEGWLELDKTEGNGDATVTLTLAEPESDSEFHTGTVTFVNGELKETLTIQHGYAQEIGGVVWAKANVGEPGFFVSSPDDPGMLYQYNSKTAWAADGDHAGMTLGTAYPVSTSWSAENDPCPEGWRVPTKNELDALVGTKATQVMIGWVEPGTSGFSVAGAVLGLDRDLGRTATSSDMKGGIFLPCSGNLNWKSGAYQNGQNATMSTATHIDMSGTACRHLMYLSTDETGNNNTMRLPSDNWGCGELAGAWPVRCIADTK